MAKLSKNSKTLFILAGVAVVAYLAYRWYKSRAASSGASGGGLGSNLNSVAPELVAGSTGPNTTAGPAVDMPITITYSESDQSAMNGQVPMLGANSTTPIPLASSKHAPPGVINGGGSEASSPAHPGSSISVHEPVSTSSPGSKATKSSHPGKSEKS